MKKFWHYITGKKSWRVHYGPCGPSVRMSYHIAVDYATIFNGRVEFDPAP